MVSMDMQKTVLPQGAEDNGKHKKPEMPGFFKRGNGMEEGMRDKIFYKSDHY